MYRSILRRDEFKYLHFTEAQQSRAPALLISRLVSWGIVD